MTEGIMNSDGSRNWQANILLDNVKRLEQENKDLNFKINQLKANGLYNDLTDIELSAKVVELKQENKQMKSALEEISGLASPHCTQCSQIINIINEVLQ